MAATSGPNSVRAQTKVEAAQVRLDSAIAKRTEAEENLRRVQSQLLSARKDVADACLELAKERKHEARLKAERTREQAKRLAKKWGIPIEKEEGFADGPLYWVWAPEGRFPVEGVDPLEGCRSCTSWDEVLEKVLEYDALFTKEAS